MFDEIKVVKHEKCGERAKYKFAYYHHPHVCHLITNISVIIWMNNEHEYKNVINLILHKIFWISNDPGNKTMVLPNRY